MMNDSPPDYEEYIREHEQEYRELADDDPEFEPLIDAMLDDVLEE